MSEPKLPVKPAVVGLTGGIGSGKSTVATMFAELGVPVLDMDRVGHQVTAPGSDGLAKLVELFGGEIVDGGQLNRSRLAEICFASAEKTQALNRIVHPLIWQQVEQWKQQQHSAYVVVEASVLIESGSCERVDHVVVVLADIETRRERVLRRGSISAEMFSAIIARQCDDGERMRCADDLLQNSGDIGMLRSEVGTLAAKLLKQFSS